MTGLPSPLRPQEPPTSTPATDITLKEVLSSCQATDYDPCAAAKPCSPFYLYKHDSPRPSCDQKGSKSSVEVTVKDIELGSLTTPHLTPTVSEEQIPPPPPAPKKWQLPLFRTGEERRCLTQPKPQGWLKSMPKRQRLVVKLVIALVIAGCMVGVAVGIAVGLKSTVYQSANSEKRIGS